MLSQIVYKANEGKSSMNLYIKDIEKRIGMGTKETIEQLISEAKSWEQHLYMFKQENIYFKTKLSEVVDPSTDKNFLALAEQFQNQFILKDEFMDELIHDVREQQLKLVNLIKTNTPLSDNLIKKQKRLRHELEYLDKDFKRIKNEFISYLANVL
jgi:hypothetical protein